MPRSSPYVLRLSPTERSILEVRAVKYTLPYREVVRAKIVLLAATGLSNDEIAGRLDMRREVVSKWRKRFYEQRLRGLDELPRHGRPAVFSPLRGGGDQGAGL
jgi:Winged helix-turn helix